MAAPLSKYYSVEEYLVIERESPERHEYYKGEIFAMSGASYEHNLIENNIRLDIGNFLKGKECRSFGSNLRVSIKANSLYTYPDVLIICGQAVFLDNEFDTILNPTVIFEILSSSTANYDKGLKFTLYREIPSLKEYILVDSKKVHVEQYVKNPNASWTLQDYKNLTDRFVLQAIQMDVLVADWYESVISGQ